MTAVGSLLHFLTILAYFLQFFDSFVLLFFAIFASFFQGIKDVDVLENSFSDGCVNAVVLTSLLLASWLVGWLVVGSPCP